MSKSHPYVCPAVFSCSLDNFLRRLVHDPDKILSPYIRKGMTVLDLGCGPGYFTGAIARLTGEEGKVIAADLQEKMLEKMKSKITGTGLEKRIISHLCGRESIGLQGKVDFILTFWMIHEVPDQQRLFMELKSLLNPGGKILIVEPKIHVSRNAFKEMTAGLESAGLEVTDIPKVSLSRSILVKLKEL